MNIILFNEDEAEAPLAKNDPRAIHLIKVLHKKAGDKFDAGIIGGNKGEGRIEEIYSGGSLKISLCLQDAPPEKFAIHLGAAMVRPIQMRRLLRDVCSMGVSEISVFGTDLQDKNYLQTTLFSSGAASFALVQGLQQSRDTVPPALNIYGSIEKWIEQNSASFKDALCIACDNVGTEIKFKNCLQKPHSKLVIAVGSERGFSTAERNMLDERGFLRATLGCRALRTETACIAACALAIP